MSREFFIGDKKVGGDAPVYIIAETGVNHNGSKEILKELIQSLAVCGVDAVKLQTYKPEDVVTDESVLYTYRENGREITEPIIDIFRRVETRLEWHAEIFEFAKKLGVTIFSTACDHESIDHLDSLGFPAFKMGSDDLTNIPLIEYIAEKKKPFLISTGMSTMAEIEDAVTAIERSGNDQIGILHCVSNYPTDHSDCNLRCIGTLKMCFDYPIGYSDHTDGVSASVAAVALGARIIEKHFTLDKKMKGPDQFFSADPKEFAMLVRCIRETEAALGSTVKKFRPSEAGMRVNCRRGVVAVRDIAAGEAITEKNTALKRPATGVQPKDYSNILGKTAKRAIKKFDPVTFDCF